LTKVPFEIKIADFGFSKYLNGALDETSGTLCGTPLYMSPQIVGESRYTYKTDIWSLGVIYYELLTGRFPFNGNAMDQLEKNLHNGLYVVQMPVKPSLEALHLLSSCLNQNEDERASIDDLSELPYLFEIGYLPHYATAANDSTVTLHRSSSTDYHRASLGRNTPAHFKLTLSSRDSQFTKQLTATLNKANSPRLT